MSRNVSFVKPPEPTFLRRIKEKIGYKEGPDIETKRQELEAANEDDYRDKDDDLPTVVQLRKGDLDQEEAHALLKNSQEQDEPAADGRIMFKKPIKRVSEGDDKEVVKKKKRSNAQPIKNKKLLSFDEDEEPT